MEEVFQLLILIRISDEMLPYLIFFSVLVGECQPIRSSVNV